MLKKTLLVVLVSLLTVASVLNCVQVIVTRSSSVVIAEEEYIEYLDAPETIATTVAVKDPIVVKPLSLKQDYSYHYTEREVVMIAQTVYGEALVTGSDMEMAAVVWCILNRVDDDKFPDNIADVVTQQHQFHGYNANNPVDERILGIVDDVLERWNREKNGVECVGRVLPMGYLYFEGDGLHNHYSLKENDSETYGWFLPNPYES